MHQHVSIEGALGAEDFATYGAAVGGGGVDGAGVV